MTNKSYAIATSLIRIGVLAAQIAMSPSAAAQATPASGSQHPVLIARQMEIALALSACPAFVKGKAAVYASEKSGYGADGNPNGPAFVAREGTLSPHHRAAWGARGPRAPSA